MQSLGLAESLFDADKSLFDADKSLFKAHESRVDVVAKRVKSAVDANEYISQIPRCCWLVPPWIDVISELILERFVWSLDSIQSVTEDML